MTESARLRAALAISRVASAVLPAPDVRLRYREQWEADIRGAADLGISPMRFALGTAAAAFRLLNFQTYAEQRLQTMPFYTKLALLFFVPSALVATVNAWAFRAYPEQWGGPNIGGGVIQFLAYVGILVSVIFFVLAMMKKRRDKPNR